MDEATPSGPSTDPPAAGGLAGGSLFGVVGAMVAAAAGGSRSAALVAVVGGTARDRFSPAGPAAFCIVFQRAGRPCSASPGWLVWC